jgi:hypothetical protein
MKLGRALSKVGGILHPSGYFRRRKKEKLYEQWVERAGLPPESVPQKRVAEEATPKVEKERFQPPPPTEKEWLQPPPPVERERLQPPTANALLYVLLGSSVTLLFVGIIFLIVQSC